MGVAVVGLALTAGCANTDAPVCHKMMMSSSMFGQRGHGMKVVPCPVVDSSPYSSMKKK